jgi:ABC-2 type transport system ATP-binding protein
MIETTGLTKRFDDFTAVDNLTINIPSGQLLALLGPNGAGKTTTLRMLSAILRPTCGNAFINGHDVVQEADLVRREIGLLTEQPGLYTRSTGLEYLEFFGSLYGMSKTDSRDRSKELFKRFGMAEYELRRLGEYSKGMRQKIGMMRAMLHHPSVLMLDEPTSAMDPHSAKLVRDAIIELKDEKRAIIVCTHNLVEAELLADKIAIISRGRIIAQGDPEDLKRQLLGRRLFELHLDDSVDGHLDGIGMIIDIESIDVDSVDARSLRYRTDEPQVMNPQLVKYLTGKGLGVVSLHEISASLEQVYLQVVESDLSEGTQTTARDEREPDAIPAQ